MAAARAARQAGFSRRCRKLLVAFACAAGPHRRAKLRCLANPAAGRNRAECRDSDGRARTRRAGPKNPLRSAVRTPEAEQQPIATFGESRTGPMLSTTPVDKVG